jgi:7-keto-8-aminopelargonate synthetase-like enzyme
VVVLDKLVHACVVDAARLSGAKLRVFAHNDLADLESILIWANERNASGSEKGNVLIVTESVFSMDGDHAPLKAIVELKERFGAWLMVDEAHATGLYGTHRRGLAEAASVTDRVEIQMGTLGKALGAAGGYIAGARELVDWLVNRARAFIFSTAPIPAATAAARAGVELVQSAEGQAAWRQLWERISQLRAGLAALDWPLPHDESPILPLIVGGESAALALAGQLRERGLFVPAIRYPTVARGAARLRVSVSTAHTAEDVERLLFALRDCQPPRAAIV